MIFPMTPLLGYRATTLSCSIMPSGKRIEIDFKLGISEEKVRFSPSSQSTYSAESCWAQNALSLSSAQSEGLA